MPIYDFTHTVHTINAGYVFFLWECCFITKESILLIAYRLQFNAILMECYEILCYALRNWNGGLMI